MEVSRPASPMGAGCRQLLPLPCLLQDSHLCSWRRLFPPVPGGPQLPRGVWESRVNSVRSLPRRQSGENWREVSGPAVGQRGSTGELHTLSEPPAFWFRNRDSFPPRLPPTPKDGEIGLGVESRWGTCKHRCAC